MAEIAANGIVRVASFSSLGPQAEHASVIVVISTDGIPWFSHG
jgi:hypothetical protein